MKSLIPYLMFNGNCEEALNFYKDALGGEIKSMQTFDDLPDPVPDRHKKKVMHAELVADNIHIMASDGMPDSKITNGQCNFKYQFY